MTKWIVLLACLASCTVGVDDEAAASETTEPESSPLAAAPVLSWPTLRSGDQSWNVAAAQYLLRDRGGTVTVDGAFGAGTVQALCRFQTAVGLSADGVLGRSTWERLVVQVGKGDQRDAVSAIQSVLKNTYGASIDVTGRFGATTETRVKEFQTDHCLGTTGVVGLYTWNALIANASYCAGSGSAAGRLLAAHNAGLVTFWDQTFGRHDGADPLSNLRDAAAGRAARTSCYGNAPCTSVQLSSTMLTAIDRMRTQYGFSFFVTAIAGANHATNSYHYAGRAIDIDEVNGIQINGDSALARSWMNACRDLGAIEVLGPNNASDHQDHLHCAW